MKLNAKTHRSKGAKNPRFTFHAPVLRSAFPTSGALLAKEVDEGGSRITHHFPASLSPLSPRPSHLGHAFTLLELLVVIGIIALISAIALPVVKSFKPDPLKTASTQLLNDLAYARHRAIADHTTVYVAFMPPLNLLRNLNGASPPSSLTPNEQQKLLNSQYTGYAMYEKRSVGDQPGASRPHWITGWHALPPGTAFPREMFLGRGDGPPPTPAQVGFGYWSFDYNTAGDIILNPETNVAAQVTSRFPTVAFDYRGGLAIPTNQWTVFNPPPVGYGNSNLVFDCVIPITQGYASPAGATWNTAGYRENPPGNFTNTYMHVIVDGPTGRARRDMRAIQ